VRSKLLRTRCNELAHSVVRSACRQTPARPPQLHPGAQDPHDSRLRWDENKAAVQALVRDGSLQSILDKFGGLVERPGDDAAVRVEVGRALDLVISEVDRGRDSQLPDLGVRYAETLKSAKLTPMKGTARGRLTRSGGVGQKEKKRLSVILGVLRLMLRNMPGGLDSALPSLSAQMAHPATRRWRIRASCILES